MVSPEERAPDHGREPPAWEPEPLHLPVADESQRRPDSPTKGRDRERPTGSHVIVIDLA